MKIFVSSSGLIWNANAPILKEYKNDVILIKMSEEDKTYGDYKTIVNPYKNINSSIGLQSEKYKKLLSVSDEIEDSIDIDIDEDILVLADNEPTTLYIFKVLQNIYNKKLFNLHLWAMLPFYFEEKRRSSVYQDLLSDTSNVKSMLLFDSYSFYDGLHKRIGIEEVFEKVKELFFTMLPDIISSFNAMDDSHRYFFDIKTNRYVDTSFIDGFERKHVMGLLMSPLEKYNSDSKVKEYIFSCEPKANGKEICEKLRELRKKFAEVNGIEFNSEECRYSGPCAGTCEKCDEELKYLQKQIQSLLDNKKIIYPYYKIEIPNKVLSKREDYNIELMEVPGFLRRKKQNDKK